jgi:FkbH-like protein
MRIVVVSNTTMQPVAARLPEHEVVVSGVGDLPRWLLEPMSPADDPTVDVVVVHADGDSLLPPLGHADQRAVILDAVERFASRHVATHVVVTTLMSTARATSTYADPSLPTGRFRARVEWDLRVSALAEAYANVTVLDCALLQESAGLESLTSDAYWYLGRIRFSALGFDAFARELSRIIDGILNRTRKVLVLDLDNTLWGGVVGEEGISGIALSEEGVGKCFRDFQRTIKEMTSDGILLAVVSKNDAALVDAVFDEHPMMALSRDDFVAVIADWSNKPDHLIALAESLGLGLDTFVFIDDNVVERELVKARLPEVAVPEFPSRPELLSHWLLHEVVPRYFPRVRVLDEDRLRTTSYKAREQRRSEESADMEAFLATLDVRLGFSHDLVDQVGRLSQLTQKTNQFNLTTERLNPAEMGALMSSSDYVVIACDYEDRFAKEGTIGLAIVDVARGRLCNLLLSCRVLGRGVEDALLAEAESAARNRGNRRMQASFVRSSRNSVASTLLERSGYTGSESEGAWTGEKEL